MSSSSSSFSSSSSSYLPRLLLTFRPFDKLPREMLASVFGFCELRYLAHFAAVDRFWRICSREAWSRRAAVKATGSMMRGGLSRILQELCGRGLSKLTLTGVGKSDEEVAASVSCFSSLMGLEELVIDSSGLNSTWICDRHTKDLHPSFATALSHLLSLRFLSLRDCHIKSKGMATLSTIFGQLVVLQSIDLYYNLE